MLEKLPTKFEALLAVSLACGTAVAVNQLQTDTQEKVIEQVKEAKPEPAYPQLPIITRDYSTYTPPAQETVEKLECNSLPCILDWLESSYLDQLSPARHQIISQFYYELVAEIGNYEQKESIDLTLSALFNDIQQTCYSLTAIEQKCTDWKVYPLITYESLKSDNITAVLADVCRRSGLPPSKIDEIKLQLLNNYPTFIRLQQFINPDTTDYDELENLLSSLPANKVTPLLDLLSIEFKTQIWQKLNAMDLMTIYSSLMDSGNGKDLYLLLTPPSR